MLARGTSPSLQQPGNLHRELVLLLAGSNHSWYCCRKWQMPPTSTPGNKSAHSSRPKSLVDSSQTARSNATIASGAAQQQTFVPSTSDPAADDTAASTAALAPLTRAKSVALAQAPANAQAVTGIVSAEPTSAPIAPAVKRKPSEPPTAAKKLTAGGSAVPEFVKSRLKRLFHA